MQNTSVIIMAKAPLEGYVKTRMVGMLTSKECTEIYQAFLLDTLDCAFATNLEVFLAYTPAGSYSLMKSLVPEQVNIFEQRGENLGERMNNAILKVQAKKRQRCIVIGCDIPTLETSHVLEAAASLDISDICLGPALDGGYYLIGMQKPYPKIFENIAWGTGYVFNKTIENIKNEALTYTTLPLLQDIDTFQDLKDLYKILNQAKQNGAIYPTRTWECLKWYNEKLY